jgi:hypothetical protein
MKFRSWKMPNNKPVSNEENLEEITEELFLLVRNCYNQGSIEIKLAVLDNCMKIILDSLERESDLKKLKAVFDNITYD